MKRVDAATIQEMVSRLAAEFVPEVILLFGSRAWGTPDDDSDVDLMVVVSESDAPPVQRVLRARRCLRGISVPKDVVVKTRRELDRFAAVPASLEHRVLKHGRVLYERAEG
jgi:predicted nucleotidyltransferase